MRETFVVRRRRPLLSLVLVMVGFALAGIGARVLWTAAQTEARQDTRPASDRRVPAGASTERLRERIAQLEADNEALMRGAMIAERGRESVQRALEQQRSEMLELREEVAFFRSLALAPDDEATFTISNFRLRGDTGDGRINYRLVLTRTEAEGDAEAAGHYTIELIGRDDAGLVRIPAVAVMTGGPEVPFEFRHYGRLDGTLRLPDDFRPLRVAVTVQVQRLGEEQTDLTFGRTFEWYPPSP